MSEFLVEAYVSLTESPGSPSSAEVLSKVAERLTQEGREVHLLRSILVPEEETCFYLFRAGSGDVVREVARRSGLRIEQLHEARSTWSHEQALPGFGTSSTTNEPSTNHNEEDPHEVP